MEWPIFDPCSVVAFAIAIAIAISAAKIATAIAILAKYEFFAKPAANAVEMQFGGGFSFFFEFCGFLGPMVLQPNLPDLAEVTQKEWG